MESDAARKNTRALSGQATHGRQWGRIVNVSSIIGLKGFPGDSAYAAAKAGLLGFTRALAVEVAPEGVTVNAVAPGFVATDMTGGLSEKAMARAEAGIPLGRQADSREVAEAVAFLVAGPDYHRVDTGDRRRLDDRLNHTQTMQTMLPPHRRSWLADPDDWDESFAVDVPEARTSRTGRHRPEVRGRCIRRR